jgi:hypothetical protein
VKSSHGSRQRSLPTSCSASSSPGLLPLKRPWTVPTHAIVGAEFVSVDIGVTSAASGTLSVHFDFTTANFAESIVSSRVDFGDLMIDVAAGEVGVTNIPLVDPEEPHDPRPWPFDETNTLWLRIKAQDAHILFNGAKLNYRRKRVAVKADDAAAANATVGAAPRNACIAAVPA